MMKLSDKQKDALKRIVRDWVDEGFIHPPYPEEYYDVFEMLGMDPDQQWYDIVRPEDELSYPHMKLDNNSEGR